MSLASLALLVRAVGVEEVLVDLDGINVPSLAVVGRLDTSRGSAGKLKRVTKGLVGLGKDDGEVAPA